MTKTSLVFNNLCCYPETRARELEAPVSFRCLAPAIGLIAVASFAQTIPPAADGHPDLQGVWSNNAATPLERPKALADHPVLSDAEVAAMRTKAKELYNGGGDAAFGDTIFETVWASVQGKTVGPHVKDAREFDAGTGDYSSEWIVQRDWDNRTSLITAPPDGKMPPLTPEAQKRAAAQMAAYAKPPASAEDRSLSERCISYGSPQILAGYQSYYQIFQTKDAVVIETEMIHDARIIHLDGRSHPAANVHEWLGDSIGHWEGDTLVIDTTNYKNASFMNATEKLHTIERLTRSGPDTLKYEITVDDPATWTKPWTLMIPLRSVNVKVYEYSCHEGNIGLAGILKGARAEEKAQTAEAGK